MKKIKKILFIGLIFGMVIASILTVAACKDSEALKLDVPQNVSVNVAEKRVTWGAVTNATEYVLLFDNGNYAEVEHNYYDYGHITDGGEYYFRVMAVGTTYNDSDWSTRRVFQVNEKLESPKNIVATESNIIWDSVKNASGYIVQIGNNEPKFVPENAYEITVFSIGQSSVKVKAISDKDYFFDSDFTNGGEFFAGLHFNLIDEGKAYELIKASTELRGDFVIPSILNDLPVTTIRSFAFEDCDKIVSITVPNSVINFYKGTFARASFQRISLSFEGINDETFFNSEKVSCFEDLFLGSAKPEEVIITGGAEIGKMAFMGLSIKKVVISSSIKKIDSSAFLNCGFLESLIIPDSVNIIGNNIFNGCYSLRNIVLPNGLTEIPQSAFFGCSSLTEIEIPNSVNKIGYNAFSKSGLKSVVIPDSVTEIGMCAFQLCTQLEDVILSKNLKILNAEIFEGTAIKNIVIPYGVEEISYEVFGEFLEYIIIPETIQAIASWTFPDTTVIFYEGTEQQWNDIDDKSVWYYNDLYFYSKIQISDGRHWGYQDGVPTIW